MIAPFDYQPRTRIIFGVGSIDRSGELSAEFDARKILVVTDPGVVKAGHLDQLLNSLSRVKIQSVVFDGVRENPTTRDVDACLQLAKAQTVDLLIGLGGGSSLDTAKGCNFLLTNGGRMQDYWGLEKASKPMLPFIAIPTTAGTGSECQSVALIADEKTHAKMACGDHKAAARVAILDPALTISQPARVTACTGIDALSHAVESAVTRKRTPLSLAFSREAFRLCAESLPRIFRNPKDIEARANMLLGAAFAGIAIENSMLGAAHSAANPLTAHFNVIHGQAVGMMLPAIVQFNSADAQASEIYRQLQLPDGATSLVDWLKDILNLAGMPKSLDGCGVDRSAIPMMAAEAAKQWTAGFNPRAIAAAEFVKLYEQAFNARCRSV
ncbi:MAG: iron-containing alcohol dehydrogenase [Limisphaerales bacterium]